MRAAGEPWKATVVRQLTDSGPSVFIARWQMKPDRSGRGVRAEALHVPRAGLSGRAFPLSLWEPRRVGMG